VVFSGTLQELYAFDHPHVREFLRLDEVSMNLTEQVGDPF